MVEPVPALVGHEHEQDEGQRAEHREALEPGKQALTARNDHGRRLRPETVRRLALEQPLAALLDQLSDLLVSPSARGNPDVLPLDPDEHRLEPSFAAELVDVGRLWDSSPRPRLVRFAQAADEEVQLERRVGEEGDPDRDPVLQPR